MLDKPNSRAEAEKLRYNRWGGNPNGTAYNPKKCAGNCYDNHTRLFSQCRNSPGFGPDGIFCKKHDPDYIAKKQAERNAKDEAKWKASRPSVYGKALFDLLKESQAGITLEWENRRDKLITAIEK